MISIIFSLYNEEEALPLLIRSIREVMARENEDYELVFVNDDSTDKSVEAILGQGKKPREQIVVVNMSRRFGVEECFMAGLETARGDCAILMYTDMQDPPETLHEMIAKWRQGADIVHAVRRQRIGEHPAKKVVVHFAYKWISAISDIKIPRDAGDFKLISRRVIDHVIKFKETEPYLRGLIPWVGYKQDFITYDLLPRQAGKSKISLFGKKAMSVFISGIVAFSDFPIHVFLFLCGAGFFGSFLALLVVVFGNSPNMLGYAFVLFLFLWSLLMAGLAIIGVYVLKIYHNTTQRPLYIIKEIIR